MPDPLLLARDGSGPLTFVGCQCDIGFECNDVECIRGRVLAAKYAKAIFGRGRVTTNDEFVAAMLDAGRGHLLSDTREM